MGLDIAFDRKKAIAAGISTKMIQNGCAESIACAQASECPDLDYLAWLSEEQLCIQVPGMEGWVSDDGVGKDFVVRANTWGRVYGPLTTWLREHNIEWSEF